jgi:hypothetical protein
MKDTSPVLILIILFVVLGLAYGPLKNAQQNQKNNSSTSSIGSNQDIGDQIKTIESKIGDINKDLNKQAEENKRSPYYGKVSMSSISGLNNSDPNREYTTLSTNLKNDEKVNITGWYLKSETTGYYAIIGQASLLPFPFTKNYNDVVLQKNDQVILTKGFSPIGISFRTNKCTGFFEENREFTPSLPFECPKPKSEKLPKFSENFDRNDECLDIIDDLPRCKTVSSAFIRDLPDTVVTSCKNYMTAQINYNSCVAKHFDDTDFPGNQYRIYLNKFGPLWRNKREKINLYDRAGLIVDSIDY